MKISGCSNIGIRRNNEDVMYINGLYITNELKQISVQSNAESDINVFAVFDGMGGESNGSLAARISVGSLRKYQKLLKIENIEKWDNLIYNFISDVNSFVAQVVVHTRQNMGATMALLITDGRTAKVYNLGDSRVYKYSKGELIQLSQDHTVAAELVEAGLITKWEAKHHVRRNMLTRHLGMIEGEYDIAPYTVEVDVGHGDQFILCSDGLTGVCDEDEIEQVLVQGMDDGRCMAGELVELALADGGHDNITVITIEI